MGSKKSLFQRLVKDLGDENTTLADDGLSSAEFGGFIDSGSYALNLLLSGTVFGGVPDNKITAFTGLSAVGKTFFTLAVMRNFLGENLDAGCMYYLVEPAVTRQMLIDRGIDTKRVIIAEPVAIEQFKTHVLRTLDLYAEIPEDERPPMMMVLDSLGALSTLKELSDSLEGKHVRDMTKAQGVKGMFRTVGLKLSKLRVPLLMTNHIYHVVGSYVPTTAQAGGTGPVYHADIIVELTKKADKDDNKNVVGNLITAHSFKNRVAREKQKVELKLSYQYGLDRYYGLLDIAERVGVLPKDGPRYILPDGSKVYGKQILENPGDYFTIAFLQRLDEQAAPWFTYGSGLTDVESPSIAPGEGD